MAANKTKQIVLKFFRILKSWEVAEVNNSAQLNPGDWINHDYLVWLNNHPDWEVKVIEPSIGHMPIPLPALPLPI